MPERDDGLGPARGCLVGMLAGIVLWGVIGILVALLGSCRQISARPVPRGRPQGRRYRPVEAPCPGSGRRPDPLAGLAWTWRIRLVAAPKGRATSEEDEQMANRDGIEPSSDQVAPVITALLAGKGEDRMVVYCVLRDPDRVAESLRSAGWMILGRREIEQPFAACSRIVIYAGDAPVKVAVPESGDETPRPYPPTIQP
jgi:hypothetical protein